MVNGSDRTNFEGGERREGLFTVVDVAVVDDSVVSGSDRTNGEGERGEVLFTFRVAEILDPSMVSGSDLVFLTVVLVAVVDDSVVCDSGTLLGKIREAVARRSCFFPSSFMTLLGEVSRAEYAACLI